MTLDCPQCGKTFFRRDAEVKYRLQTTCRNVFCSMGCAQAAKRTDTRTPEQKKEDKAEYDRQYRERNRDRLKAKKAAWYQANHDREREREIRKARMPLHIEYCRQPKYKAYKAQYDINRRASVYGPFAEAYKASVALTKTIRERRIPR